jgi:DNA-binding NtrC family response regulator
MSNPEDNYPKHERMYPSAHSRLELAAPSFGPDFEAEIGRLAPSRVTVLLVGGTLASKERVALALHARSPRASHPFVTLDCAGRDADSVELALFGGPVYAVLEQGAIQRAGAGTLYVAAIDDLPLLLQPRFLRFLDQERAVRVVASTETALLLRAQEQRFRLDLAERLCLIELVLPTARE